LRRRQGWWLGDSRAQGGQRKAEFFIFEHGVDELNDWAPILLQKMLVLPKFGDVASDQQRAGRTLKIEVNRDVASRHGVDPALVHSILYDAFDKRYVALIYTTLNQYCVILEVDPGYQLGPNALSRIYTKSGRRRHGPAQSICHRKPLERSAGD
jgi:multidrug efflux pump subunit AcrB